MNKLDKLIGIPFKLGGIDFDGCDCRGICYLYHKHVHGVEFPYDDGKRIKFRNPKNDKKRINDFLCNFCHHIGFQDLEEGDFVIMKAKKDIGVLGVCVDNKKILYTTKRYGSCMAKISLLKDIFILGYRPFYYESNN